MMGDPIRIQNTYENIFIGARNGPQVMGKFKLADAGIGFQEAVSKKVITMRGQDIRRALWQRSAKDFELRLELANGNVHKFCGFPRDSFESISELLRANYNVTLDAKEISLRGYNWGKAEFQGSYLTFNVNQRPSFEIPLADVANTTPIGKNDVSIELTPPESVPSNPADPTSKPARIKEDTLVEIHFYVPGMAVQSQVDESGKLKDQANEIKKDGEEGEIDETPILGDDGEALTSAALFCETIKARADIGVASQGESLVTFEDLLCLTPRGRFEVDMFATFFRIRGKSNDYRILFNSIKRLFLLPKPDDLHTMFVIQLDPPLRQGQTRYPFLVFQFDRDEEIDANLNLDEETIKAQYGEKLRKDYDGPIFMVVSEIFKGLSGANIISPGGSYKSTQSYSGVKCALKANEAFLFPLEKSFISVAKPATLIPHSEVNSVTFSRVNSSSSSTKTIEMKISTGGGEYAYTSISREEYQGLATYCRDKKLRLHTDLGDGDGYEMSDIDDDEDGDKKRKRIQNMKDPLGGDLDDSESEDEDFQEKDSDSDVDLEYDSSASESDDSDNEAEGESGGEGGAEEKPEKKKKENREKSSKSSSSKKQNRDKNGEPEKKKAKKDPNAPKGPQSSYIVFSNAVRNQVKEEDSSLSMTDISKKIGVMWKELSADEKKKYEDMAAQDKERYIKEMAAYKQKGDSGSSSKVAPDSPQKSEKIKSSEFVGDEDDG